MLYPLSYERGCPDSLRHPVPRSCSVGNTHSAQRFRRFRAVWPITPEPGPTTFYTVVSLIQKRLPD
jgi:hypothetical protein